MIRTRGLGVAVIVSDSSAAMDGKLRARPRKKTRHSTVWFRRRHRWTGFGRPVGLCILAGILPSRKPTMLAKLIEFATNHYVLSGSFVVLLALLLAHELRRSGRAISTRELTTMV